MDITRGGAAGVQAGPAKPNRGHGEERMGRTGQTKRAEPFIRLNIAGPTAHAPPPFVLTNETKKIKRAVPKT